MNNHLVKSTSTIVSLTMLSRVFGFVRDMVTAQVFGAGFAFDAFSAAFRIPGFIRQLFAEGAFSQAFVPVLAEYQNQSPSANIRQFINAMAGTFALVLFLVTIVGMIFAPSLVHVFVPGFPEGSPRFDLTVTMMRIMFPYLFLVSLTAYAGAILNTYSRFWVPAFTPVLLNIAMIGAALWLAPRLQIPIIALAWGVLIAGILQLAFQWPFLKKLKLLTRPVIHFRDSGVMKVLRLSVPALFGVAILQINLLLDGLFASFLVVGSVSWLYFSDRIMDVPLGVFGVAISTAILPHLSRLHATQSNEAFSATLDWGLRAVLLIGVPAAFIFALMSGQILTTLFQYGAFDAHAVLMTQKSLTAFAVGITPFMLVKVLAAGFYAKQNMRTPVKIGLLSVFTNIVFNVMLMWPLAHAGIALSTSLAAIVNMGFLYYFLRRFHIYKPNGEWKSFFLQLLFANCVMAVWLRFVAGDVNVWIAHSGVWRAEHLALLVFSAIGIYFLGLKITGVRLRSMLLLQSSG